MLSTSAKAAAAACTTGQDTACGLSWENPESKWPTASAKDGNLGEVFNVLEIVQGLLYPSAKALNTAKVSGGGNASGTQSGGASNSSGSGSPQQTGTAGSIAVSSTAVLAVVFAALLSC
jgi:mannan endo-1,6-alpha-mannosidase